MDATWTSSELVEFFDSFERAQETHDFDRVAPMIHPQALFRFNDGDFRGVADIRAAFERTWAHDVEDERYWMDDLEVLHAGAECAVVTFAFHWSGTGPKGFFQVDGRGSSVVVRHAGSPVILLEHLSG